MTRRFASVAVLAAVVAVALSACSSGPSQSERDAWAAFAQARASSYAAPSRGEMASIKDYVLGTGTGGIAGADAILTGSFTGASAGVPENTPSGSVIPVIATFKVHKPVVNGGQGATVLVNLGPMPAGIDVDAAVRGADNVVIFIDLVEGQWRLVDGEYAIASVTGDTGRLGMPLVPIDVAPGYLTGVSDVADIEAIAIAGSYDKGGVLTGSGGSGDSGTSGQQQSAIDKANELAGNG